MDADATDDAASLGSLFSFGAGMAGTGGAGVEDEDGGLRPIDPNVDLEGLCLIENRLPVFVVGDVTASGPATVIIGVTGGSGVGIETFRGVSGSFDGGMPFGIDVGVASVGSLASESPSLVRPGGKIGLRRGGDTGRDSGVGSAVRRPRATGSRSTA